MTQCLKKLLRLRVLGLRGMKLASGGIARLFDVKPEMRRHTSSITQAIRRYELEAERLDRLRNPGTTKESESVSR